MIKNNYVSSENFISFVVERMSNSFCCLTNKYKLRQPWDREIITYPAKLNMK